MSNKPVYMRNTLIKPYECGSNLIALFPSINFHTPISLNFFLILYFYSLFEVHLSDSVLSYVPFHFSTIIEYDQRYQKKKKYIQE